MSVKPSMNMKKKMLIMTLVLVIGGFGSALVSLVNIMFVHGEEYSKMAADQQSMNTTLAAERGNIYDTNMNILATSATINSGAHKKQILDALPSAEVIESAGTLLVPIVEEGWTDDDDAVALNTLKRYLAPMIDAGVDTLILGCTHFPVLTGAISKILGEGVTLINMGVSTAQAVKERLLSCDALNDGTVSAKHEFFVSDKTATFKKTADILLGDYDRDFNVEQVDIEKI